MNSKSVDRGLRTLRGTDSTEHIYRIKHQKTVRNCFKPMHFFPSLHFCLGLPLFSACRKGMERFAMALAYTRDGRWTPPSFLHLPPGSGPGTGMQQTWGRALFGAFKGCLANRWQGKSIPDATLLILPARQVVLHRHMEEGCSCGRWEWPGTKWSKMVLGWTLASKKPTWALTQR